NHLIFDLGNTLINFNLHLASERLAKEFQMPEEEIYHYLFRSDFFVQFEKGDIGPVELVSKFNQKFDQDLTVSAFDDAFSPIFAPRTEMISLVETLVGKYELSILSNTNVLHWRYLEGNYPFLMQFDNRFYSFIMRALKPNPDIFNRVLSQTRTEPGECLFIDDLEIHVEGARRSGIDAIHFQGEEKLRDTLREKGIN
ncbi:MAG: HAD family phosphatase, partial [Nitrospirae bacterium]|nr:HAD family phosphatase [Nitrospirota bacterium]